MKAAIALVVVPVMSLGVLGMEMRGPALAGVTVEVGAASVRRAPLSTVEPSTLPSSRGAAATWALNTRFTRGDESYPFLVSKKEAAL